MPSRNHIIDVWDPAIRMRSTRLEWWRDIRIAYYRENASLLHVCHERDLMKERGFEYAPWIRRSYPMMWFNFTANYLHVSQGGKTSVLTDLSAGVWGLDKMMPRDLSQLRKFSLNIEEMWHYYYGGEVPQVIHKAVQLYGSLTEQLLADKYSSHVFLDLPDVVRKYEIAGTGAGWKISSNFGPNEEEPRDGSKFSIAVDIAAEELLGHRINWTPERVFQETRVFIREYHPNFVKSPLEPMKSVCQDAEARIRNHSALFLQATVRKTHGQRPKSGLRLS